VSLQGLVATARFGLGAAPGEIAAAAQDPKGWVLEQLKPQPMPAELMGLPTGVEGAAIWVRRVQAQNEARRAPRPSIGNDMEPRDRGLKPLPDPAQPQAGAKPGAFNDGLPRETYLREAARRTLAQAASRAPVFERLVAFWSNHFTVSVQRPPILGLAGAFEREAIRPHVLGRFEDMLLAVARHPAMLFYLDNAVSIGPDSRVGQTRQRGLNENLAREILELHTIGVNGGYTQDDVRALALVLTGWSIGRPQDDKPGHFLFRQVTHQPGEKTLLGNRYGAGEAEGVKALKDLARHPATARHIAVKLARHFIADDPPAAGVERLRGVFLSTGGDLAAVTRALVEDKEAWARPLSKLRSPNELVVAALRATALRPSDDRQVVGSLRRLGQAPFAAPSPAGWPDRMQDWVAPEAMLRRVEWAGLLAARLSAERAPLDVFHATIAPAAAEATRLAVERAPSARDGLALVLASPEFQRR
jgi:uncharacterized protein (DUF1800 family)